jgi:hypothetical protein
LSHFFINFIIFIFWIFFISCIYYFIFMITFRINIILWMSSCIKVIFIFFYFNFFLQIIYFLVLILNLIFINIRNIFNYIWRRNEKSFAFFMTRCNMRNFLDTTIFIICFIFKFNTFIIYIKSFFVLITFLILIITEIFI